MGRHPQIPQIRRTLRVASTFRRFSTWLARIDPTARYVLIPNLPLSIAMFATLGTSRRLLHPSLGPWLNKVIGMCFGMAMGGWLGLFHPILPVVCAESYTPEHAKVKELVNKGLNYLMDSAKAGGTGRWNIGSRMLTAYAILKTTDDHDNAIVHKAADEAVRFAKGLANREKAIIQAEKIIYEAAIAAMFLAAADPEKYKTSVEQVRDFLLSVQRDSGGFNYLISNYKNFEGDVSQSQYVSLAFWSIKQAGFLVDESAIERLTRWLLKVQQNDGGWSYQFPANNFYPASHSRTAAGLSATLVGADALGILRAPGAKFATEADDLDLPAAFRQVVVKENSEGKGGESKSISRNDIQRCVAGSARWFAANAGKKDSEEWHYYWMYSRERYESFLELFLGKREPSPDWYNRGVEELIKDQSRSGAWGESSHDESGPEAATCFAILFLLRNTQKSIGAVNTAESVGGYGLGNVTEVSVVDGKLIDKSKVASIEDAMKLLEGNNTGATDNRLLADRIVLDPDPKKKKEQLNRFARLLRSPDTQARRVAAKLLGRGDDLDFAPDLIFALSEGEGDSDVLRIAENSLRILSRQLDTYKLPKEGAIGVKDRVAAEQYWKSWYLSVRPDHVFVNQ